MLDVIQSFFVDNFPSAAALLLGGPPALLFGWVSLAFAGYCKKRYRLPTGYTRKIFHFLIFFGAAFVQFRWRLPGVCLFGAMVSLVILYALIRGDGHSLYEAIAREKDAPFRTHYIVIPYLATLLGGIAVNILFSSAAIYGYLVTGLGDAIGEPVGTRFGKHRYRVPSFKRIQSTRSYEGSLAVLLVSIPAIIIAFQLTAPGQSLADHWPAVFIIAIAGTVVEAFSPHGWDNTTMQIIPAMLAAAFLN